MTDRDLETRVQQFQALELPGQPRGMHMGTSYLVSDLWREVQKLRASQCAAPPSRSDAESAKPFTTEQLDTLQFGRPWHRGEMTIVKHMHDAESRAIIDRACGEIAKVLSDRDMWKAPWRVEVDGCVFKFKIDGYPKHGTPKDIERQRYLAELSAEADAHEAG